MRNLVIVCAVLAAFAVIATLAMEHFVSDETLSFVRERSERTDASQDSATSAGQSASPQVQTNRPNVAAPSGSLSRSVSVQSARDGHFYLTVRINGEPVRAVVDTGASLLALRESDARKIGLWIRQSDFSMPLATANGRAFGAPVTLRNVSYGSIRVRDVDAVVIPDTQLSVSLLGNTFLGRLRSFEVRGERLLLEN